jgi:hypothetical protein
MTARIEPGVRAAAPAVTPQVLLDLTAAGFPVDPGAEIRWTRAGRHHAMLVDDPARGALFVKRTGAPLSVAGGGELSLKNEIFFYRMVRPAADALVAAHVPGFVFSSQDCRYLVVEGLSRHESLLDTMLRGDAARLPDPAVLAGFLAGLHRPPGPEWRGIGRPARPDVMTFDSVSPAGLVARPPSYGDFLRFVQPRLPGALRALGSRWSPGAVVHGDLTAGNILVEPGRGRSFSLVDWELAGLGDPAADLGTLAGSVLWAALMAGAAGRSPSYPVVRAWLTRLLSCYDAAAPGAVDAPYALQWAGYWIVERVCVTLPAGDELPARARDALNLAADLLCGG